SFSYTPDPNFFGTDSFTYKAKDNENALSVNPATVTITVDGDSDDDGLPDDWERLYFGNLGQSGTDDPDGDGLNNLQELEHGTNPTLADTDYDGRSDSEELAEATDPLNPQNAHPVELGQWTFNSSTNSPNWLAGIQGQQPREVANVTNVA